ncbi:MAG TPA: PQQ-binding-like beta-propeller repeat protein, partial [Chthoniobacteraceae bacterium]
MKRLHFTLALLLSLVSAQSAELPGLPQPATSFGATLADGWLYIYGGNAGKAHEFHRESVKGDFFRLRMPGGTEWEKLSGGPGLVSPSLVAHEGKIIRIGGLQARNAPGEKNDLHSTSDVVRFDPTKQVWEPLPSLPEPRSSHDAVIVGNTLHVGGGWKLAGEGQGENAVWSETAYSLDLSAPERGWQTLAQPFQRRALATVSWGGRIWFIGGMNRPDEPSLEVDWCEIATGKWGKGPNLPEGLMAGFGVAACVSGDRLLVSPLSGKISALSADESRWEEVAELEPARFFHRLLPLADGQLLAVGGSNRKAQLPTLQIVELTPTANAPVAKLSTATPWPQWRGPQRDGVSPETGWRKDWPAEGPRVLWRAQVGVGMSSCVLASGRMITQGNDGKGNDHVVALDAATGEERWRHSFPCVTAAHEMPIVPAGPGATPTIADGQVYAVSREGDFVCLDAATGALVWRQNLITDLGGKRPVYGYTQSPLVENGRIFVDLGSGPDGTGSTAALEAASGKLLWRAGKGEAGYSSARSFERDGQRYVAMFKGEGLDVFDPADGKTIFSHRTTSRDFTNAVTPVLVGHRLLVSNTG